MPLSDSFAVSTDARWRVSAFFFKSSLVRSVTCRCACAASVETAKESERGIVDIETLKKTNQELIQTLDDVMKIQQEGREKRQAAEADMRRMENELKTKLLEIRR